MALRPNPVRSLRDATDGGSVLLTSALESEAVAVALATESCVELCASELRHKISRSVGPLTIRELWLAIVRSKRLISDSGFLMCVCVFLSVVIFLPRFPLPINKCGSDCSRTQAAVVTLEQWKKDGQGAITLTCLASRLFGLEPNWQQNDNLLRN